MAWTIEFDRAAERELRKLGRVEAQRILRFLNDRVAPLPDVRSLGEALKGSTLGGLWKYRVGDYRIIALIEDAILRVLVVRVGHRRVPL
jgi:mRNA interferase RelE/StbE